MMGIKDGESTNFQLEIRLLGLPQITWRGETFSLARRQARGLLYYLANALAPISRDQLIFLFWPAETENKARRNLTRLASYLRKELPHPEILLATSESFQLNPDRVWVDTERFSQMTAEADTREQAVALYRGAFLMGFSLASCPEFDLWLTEEQGKYEAELLNTLAELVRIKESQGKYRTAIEYAQKYLSVDKLAEEMHRQLITLYNAHGNRSGALKQYEICVTELERELGVSPLPETRAAYAAVLRGERSKARLPIPKPAWRELPSLQLPLMGREAAWRALKQAYRTLRTGGLILILGEAGIGKTRLMRQFVMDDSHTVLIGNGHAPTRSLPYYPLVTALRQALLYSQLWIDIPSLWLGEITPLLPDLNDYFNGLPSTLEFEPEHAQSRLFEALTQVIFGLASQDHPLILCLDDLHWADEATLGWLSAVSSRLPGSQVCIFATSRQEEPDSIQSVRQAYQRAGLYAEVSLNGISFRAIGDLLKHVSGDKKVSATLAARLARITGGNPFFILETVKALLESGQMDEAEEQLPLPKTVRETIQTRLMRLTLLARQILDAAAVLSPTLEPVLLRETSGRTEHEVADGLDELTRHQILQDEAGGLTFHHELARMVVYQMLTPWRRSLLHRRAAEALAEVYRKNPDPVISQIAQHYDAAGKLEKAVASYYQAALVSRRVYAHGEVIEYLQRALKLFSTTTLKWPKLIKFYEHLGESLTIVGNYETALKAYRDCLDCIPLAAYLPRVKIKTKLATTCDRLNLFDKAKEICRDALLELEANSDDRHIEWQQAWLDIHLAKLELFYRQAKSKEMQALLQEIQPVIEHAGTPEQRARFYEQHTAYRLRQDRYVVSAEIVLSIEANIKAALEIGNPVKIADAKFRYGFGLLWSGNLEAAIKPLKDALKIGEDTGMLMLQLQCHVYLACLRRLQGDVDGTRNYAKRSLAIGQQLNSIPYIGAAYGNLAWIEWKEGKVYQAEHQALEALSVWGDYQYPFKWLANWVLLIIYLQCDQLEKAVETATQLLDHKQHRLPDDVTSALEGGVKDWEISNFEENRGALEQAVNLAIMRKYL